MTLPTPASAAREGFRLDINGLRAWAVAAVVLFHFGVPGFGGGFVGVDVFFVISGFLMTGIVVRGLEGGGFSVWAFYMARVRRIVPALAALCAALLGLGWWLLTPTDYKVLGSHVLASLAFLSNIKYHLEAGYFDAASHEKWLLHTWSLAVEWQFYMVLPLALWALWKLRPGRVAATWALAAAAVASCALCVALTAAKPSFAFFLLPTRAWEMLAGGLVFLLAPRLNLAPGQRKLLEAVGLLLVAACMPGLDSSMAWPGWRAAVPVGATVLVLLAARQSSPWTGARLAQWLGTRSYSIYLWHWPVVVALLYADLRHDPRAIAVGLVLTALLGHLSYQWVERPARVRLPRVLRGVSLNKAHAALALASVVAVAGLAVRMRMGVPGRLPQQVDVMSMETWNKNARRDECHTVKGVRSVSCMYGGPQRRAIVLGDSHADSMMTAVAAALPRQGLDGVVQWSYSSCPIVQGSHRVRDLDNRCADFVDWALETLKTVPPDVPVIIVNRHAAAALGENEDPAAPGAPKVYFSKPYATPEPAFIQEYSERLVATTCLIARDHPVYLVRPTPEMGVNVPNAARAMVWHRYRPVEVSMDAYQRRNGFVWAAQDAARERCGAKILDPLPFLCPDGRCPGAIDGRPLYYDDDHLSESGNKRLVGMYRSVFEDAPSTSVASAATGGHAGRKP